jgi:hypothetical protein
VGAHYPTYVHICPQIRCCNFSKCHDGHSRQRSTTFLFTPYRNLDGDMWDDVESGIAHLSLLNLVFAHGYPLNILAGLGSGHHG